MMQPMQGAGRQTERDRRDDTGLQILMGGGRCDDCTCKHGWSCCPKLSMSDENYDQVRYRENQT